MNKRDANLYTENYNILLKDIKEDLNKYKAIPRSWTGRFHIAIFHIAMVIFPTLVYGFNTMLTKILATFFAV